MVTYCDHLTPSCDRHLRTDTRPYRAIARFTTTGCSCVQEIRNLRATLLVFLCFQQVGGFSLVYVKQVGGNVNVVDFMQDTLPKIQVTMDTLGKRMHTLRVSGQPGQRSEQAGGGGYRCNGPATPRILPARSCVGRPFV